MKRLEIHTLNISAHPNAGLPNAFGKYDQTPEEMQQLIREYLQENFSEYNRWLLWNNSRPHQINIRVVALNLSKGEINKRKKNI